MQELKLQFMEKVVVTDLKLPVMFTLMHEQKTAVASVTEKSFCSRRATQIFTFNFALQCMFNITIIELFLRKQLMLPDWEQRYFLFA